MTTWQNRTETTKRSGSIYVGITRAKRLAVFAVPCAFGDRLKGTSGNFTRVNFQLHAL